MLGAASPPGDSGALVAALALNEQDAHSRRRDPALAKHFSDHCDLNMPTEAKALSFPQGILPKNSPKPCPTSGSNREFTGDTVALPRGLEPLFSP